MSNALVWEFVCVCHSPVEWRGQRAVITLSHTHLFRLEAVCAAADRMRAQGERCSRAHDKRVCRRSLSRAARERGRERGRGGEWEREGQTQ